MIAAGMSYVAGSSKLRIDRLVGPEWVTDMGTNTSPATGIVGLPDGDYAAISWDEANYTSIRYRFDSTGLQTAEENTDWTPPNVPLDSFEAPVDLAADKDGNFYATGVFATGQSYDTFMLRKFAAND